MKKLRKYAVITRVSLTNAMTYRASILARFCFYTLFIYVFVMLWRSIYQEGSVHGYAYAQMVWYLIFTEFVGFSCGTSIFTVMNEDVKSGSIAYLLGRPAHYVLYQFANSLGQVLMNLFCFGILSVALGLIFVGPLPAFRIAGLPPLLISVALSIVINFFFLMLIGLSSFIMEDNSALFFIYQKINFILGMFLPVEFLPAWLQPVAKNLPFSYIYWAPAKMFVDYSPELFRTLVPRQAMWAALFVTLALVFYRISVRSLQVNGG
jgi:ABC-2 type transport system permease protein